MLDRSPMEKVTPCEGCKHEEACINPETCILEDERLNAEASLKGTIEPLEIVVLEAQVQKVAKLRVKNAALSTELKGARNKSESLFQEANKELLEEWGETGASLSEEETKLRKLILDAYIATGQKKPADGVGVRIGKRLQYDENSIKQWAIKNGHIMFLQLDRVVFEGWYNAQRKAKRELPSSMAESGAAVMEYETQTTTVAKDLKVD
jgi:hypothetical protein